jgi:transcriptional regulator with XRE-family HTH domain
MAHQAKRLMFNILPEQCRGARGLLGMSQATLAEAADVSRNVIIDFENENRVPTRNNLAAIRRALETAGIEFIGGDKPGVRLKNKSPWPA